MKLGRLLASAVLLAAVPVREARACGPFFPVSYFPGEFRAEDERAPETTVSTNAATACYDAYRVTPHLGTELAMIGAHYYPAWTGRAPKGNHVSTAQADRLDFLEAGAAAGRSREQVAEDWSRFVAFRDGVCRRLEGGEKVEVPGDAPDYALEFYLYKLGHAQWLVFRNDADPKPFGRLLALPKARRMYRTAWVHFVRIANARTFVDKDRHLDALRRAVDAGFRDTAALESFALRFLSATCRERYDPLVLTAYAQAKWEDWPGFAKRIFYRRRPSETPSRAWVEKLCADPVGVEVAVAFGAGGSLPSAAARPETPVLGADRQAWIAFHRGDLELCRKLLALAPARSLVRLFLEARLARLDGDLVRAAELLHAWLAEYARKGGRAADPVTGYGIAAFCEAYWDTGEKIEGMWNFSGKIAYSGAFGPRGGFDGESMLVGEGREHPDPRSHEPTLARVVAGELGVVMVATRDLEEALHAFLLARNWLDVAFVAERCMTVDELVRFMRGTRIGPRDRDLLRGLLMRRLLRSGRLAEASEWAPPDLKGLCDEFVALTAQTRDLKSGADARAVAYFNLARLVQTRGMELMGTELRPDVAIYEGSFASDALPVAEPTEVPARLGPDRTAACWAGWTAPEDRVHDRFHYRRRAMAYARAAAQEAKDADVRAWSLMLGGVAALSLRDDLGADWFYKKLATMRHPRAKVPEWFKGPAYQWFKDEYVDRERRRTPLRVPPRLTIGQIRGLKAPGAQGK